MKNKEEPKIAVPVDETGENIDSAVIPEQDPSHEQEPVGDAADAEREPAVEAVPETPLETATRQAAEYLDALQRLMAEFDNYRKRMAKEKQRLAEVYQATVLQAILPALDSFDAALQHTANSSAGDTAKGISLIYSVMMENLGKLDFKKMNLLNTRFDPELSEAIMVQPTEEVEPGFVIGEISAGYIFKGNVLRPARVVVSEAPRNQGSAEAVGIET